MQMTTDRAVQIDNIGAYQAFLLIHAAHADIQFTPNEQQLISDKFGAEVMDNMTKLYYSMNEFQALETIKRLKANFITDKSLEQKMRSNIISIFEADGEYSRSEKSFLFFLDHYLELSN